jgi:hypothetical protein
MVKHDGADYPAEEVSVNEPPMKTQRFLELLIALQGDMRRYNGTLIPGRLYMSEPDWVLQKVTLYHRFSEPGAFYWDSRELLDIQYRPEENRAVFVVKNRACGEYSGEDYERFEIMVNIHKP